MPYLFARLEKFFSGGEILKCWHLPLLLQTTCLRCVRIGGKVGLPNESNTQRKTAGGPFDESEKI